MDGHTLPKLVMGSVEEIGMDGESSTPLDEAVIFIEGDEYSEIRISYPGALRMAPEIVRAVNSHPELVKALERIIASNQIERRTAVQVDPAGNTYAIEMVDGSCAQIARAALARLEGK